MDNLYITVFIHWLIMKHVVHLEIFMFLFIYIIED